MDNLRLFIDPGHDLPLTDLLGESVAVLGIKGSGKSNTAARIVEQLLASGVPLVVADIAGEYWGLKEKFPLVVAGHSANTDIEITKPDQAAALAVWSIKERVSVILDVSDYRKDMRLSVLKAYFEALWREAGALRRPYQIVLEEAHNYIPQAGTTDLTEILTTIATEGRKRGLGILMIGQRSARIDKNVLTQAGIFVLHRVQHPADLRIYEDIVPKPRTWTRQQAVALEPGQAILVTKDEPKLVRVLQRETYHAGYTPGMDQVKPPTLNSIDAETLKTLQGLLGRANAQEDDGETVQLKKLVGEQELTIGNLREEVAKLQAEVDRLSKLTVQMPERAVFHLENGQLAANSVVYASGSHETGIAVAAPGPVVVAPTAVVPVTAEEPYKSPLATTRGIAKQERDFSGLIMGIKHQISPLHRAILKYLLQFHTQAFTRKDLARFLGYQESTLKDRPPLPLVNLNLITRTIRENGTHVYSAIGTEERLERLFPDLTFDMIAKLIQACEG